jgi:NAD(P)H-nitrite reductase large subunit
MTTQTQSIFTMENVNEVIKMNFEDARKFAIDLITKAEGVKPETKVKARNTITRVNTSQKIAFAMSSWILAHPSEGLKVVKVMA